MMAGTHALFSVTCTSMVLGTANLPALSLCALASQLPDVDTRTSHIGRILKPLSRFFSRWPHRTVSHGFLASLGIGILVGPLMLLGVEYWWATVLGFTFGWMGDVLTKTGVACLWPLTTRRVVFPGQADWRLETGSPGEGTFLILCSGVLILTLLINWAGGGMRVFSQTLGLTSGAIATVNQEIDQYLLTASFEGRNTLTQQTVANQCAVIRPLTQTDLLINCNSNLYRLGSTSKAQISPNWIRIHRGPQIQSAIEQLTFSEHVFAVPGGLGPYDTVTGVLRVEAADELRILPRVEVYDPITLQPLAENQAQLRIESAFGHHLLPLEGFFVTGQLVIRRIHVHQ